MQMRCSVGLIAGCWGWQLSARAGRFGCGGSQHPAHEWDALHDDVHLILRGIVLPGGVETGLTGA